MSLPERETMMQPTLGLGAVHPRADSPSTIALAIHCRSSVKPELLLELLELAPLLLLAGFLGGLLLLLVGDDVGVSPVRWIELDVGRLRRRFDADLGVDEEDDDDDRRDQD